MAKQSDFDRAEAYQKSIGGNLHVIVEDLQVAIGVAEKGVDQFGRLTEEGAKNFAELTSDLGRKELKKQQDIQKQTDKIQKDLNKAFGNLAKRIPIIGKDLEKGFEKMMKSMTTKMDKIIGMTWGRLGAGMKGAMKVGAGGIVAAGALVLKQFNEIEKATIGLSKQTGLTGKNLQSLSRVMKVAQGDSYQFGITMKESADATAAMVTSLGGFVKVSPEMVKNATLLAKFTGLSAEAAAKFQGDMIKAFGMTSKDVMRFQNAVKDIATRSGVNARKVVADIMQDTQLSAMYMSRGEEYLKRSAIQAVKLGKSMKETANATKIFLDMDTSAEIVGEINQYMGASLNSLELFNLAAKGDTEAVINRLGQAFSNPRGIAFIEEMPGLAEKFGKKLGFSLKEMRIMANLEKEVGKEIDHHAAQHESIAQSVAKQQTTFNQIANQFKQDVFPIANDLAESLLNLTKSVGAGNIKAGLITAAVTGIGLMGAKALLGTRLQPMWVRMKGGFGGAAVDGGPVATAGGANQTRWQKMKGGVGRAMKGRGGKMALAGLGMGAGAGLLGMLGMGGGKTLLKKIPVVGAAVGLFLGIKRMQAGDWVGGMMEIGSGVASILPGWGTGVSLGIDAALMAKDSIGMAAKGAVVNKPTLFMAGEEGLPEMIIPTGRIARGMPINKSVADGLGGMGVPGFAGGRYGAVRGMSSQQQAAAAAAAAQATQQGSMADPQTQRVRQIQFEQDAQKRKAEQRASMRMIEEKSLEILEEERKIAMDVGGPIGNFANKLGLWEKAKEAAAKYAKKTADRFWENLKNNNGNVMGALKETWQQTVGDIKGLQERLYSKLEQWGNQLMQAAMKWGEKKLNQGLNWIKGKASDAVDWGMDRLDINNRFNREQFKEGMSQLGDLVLTRSGARGQGNRLQNWANQTRTGAHGSYSVARNLAMDNSISDSAKFSAESFGGGKINTASAYVGATIGKIRQQSKAIDTTLNNIDPNTAMALARGDVGGALKNAGANRLLKSGGARLDQALAGTRLGGAGSSLVAGAGGLARGDFKGAAQGVGLELGRRGIEKGATQLAGKLGASAGLASGIGGGVAAGAIGAASGLMRGDMKAAGRGALEGAVGYALGALLPLPPPLNLMAGSFLAGPVTSGIITTGKELGKGAKNMGKGVGQIFKGDFKAGAGNILKGGGQALLAGIKGTGALIKGIGSALGLGGKGVAGWSTEESRAKVVSQMAQGMRANKPLLTAGGVFTQDKWKKGMAQAVKLGEKGPDQAAMQSTMADIMRTFDVGPDIAEAFIFAALGANMDKTTKMAIENEITNGWGRQVGKGGWQADYDAGKKMGWKQFRSLSRNADNTTSEAAAAYQKTQTAGTAAQLAAGGFTKDELQQLGIHRRKGSGDTGVGHRGNVYLDGVIVGVVAGSAAADSSEMGLPTGFFSDDASSNK